MVVTNKKTPDILCLFIDFYTRQWYDLETLHLQK